MVELNFCHAARAKDETFSIFGFCMKGMSGQNHAHNKLELACSKETKGNKLNRLTTLLL